MSQIDTVSGSQKGSAKERRSSLLRDFEWTWVAAVVVALGLTVYMVVFTAVIPSFWLYFADQKLHWDGSSAHTYGPLTLTGVWVKLIRDAIAMGIVTVFFVIPFVVGTIMQNMRRKLRGQTDSRPSGGYR